MMKVKVKFSYNFNFTYYWSLLVLIIFFFSENMRWTFFGEYAQKADDIKIKYIILLISFGMIYLHSPINIITRNKFYPESKYFWYSIGSLFITTIIYQASSGFHVESINEFLYVLVPFLFVSCIVSSNQDITVKLIDSCFILALISYALTIIQALVVGRSSTAISFSDSYSPFENGLSPYFVYFELYYLFKKDKKKSLLCVFLTLLSLKRLCLLKAIVFYIFFSFTPFKKIDKRLYWITIVGFIIAPILLELFYRGWGVKTLESLIGKDVESFTMTRYSVTQYVLCKIDTINFGLGTSVYMLKDWLAKSLHSDILRIYLEGTIFSTIIYTIGYFKMVQQYNLFSFLIIFHLFSEGLINHWMLGAGITCQWIIIYLILFYINRSKDDVRNIIIKM